METYLVGGAVRDHLLGLPVREKDWLIVGGKPEHLLSQGYQQVGKDFPVFLHPVTHEEYALARKERKTGNGYGGFTCDFSPEVTLEEDLSRRDLTINAMARDADARIYDPFGGQRDIYEKKLRHVSDAFLEDPVRILRIARFAARFHALGFEVADETRILMMRMVRSGELRYLVPERVSKELLRALQEPHPEVFFTVLRACGALAVLFPEIDRLFGVPQTSRYHPEIDAGVHTMMALRAAVALSEDVTVRFATLVHDLGKGITPQNQWPRHIGHELTGVDVIEALCHRLRIPNSIRAFAVMACRYHIVLYQLKSLKPVTIVKILEKTTALKRPEWFAAIIQVSQADMRGRLGCEAQEDTVSEHWLTLLARCRAMDITPFLEKGLTGEAMKAALHTARVQLVKEYMKEITHEK